MNSINLWPDPIVPELLRTRLEAIGQEAGAAVEQTAISPIVTESKDYSVTIMDTDGRIIAGFGLIDLHFGAVQHAVTTTIKVHGDTVAEGDVFLANDPHSGGGLHPQDIVIQRPVFFEGQRIGWVALAAHMMDMGGMVPGSSAVHATEMLSGGAPPAAGPAHSPERRVRGHLEHLPHQCAQFRPD
jgi:N-methylhydantoinase B